VTIRVGVADDQQLMRVALCGILGSAEDVTVVGEAGTGIQAVELCRRERPDLLLVDIRMPDMDGLEATELITGSTDVRVLVLTTYDLDEYVYRALRGGASGFLLKDMPPLDLLTAVRVVAGGHELLAPGLTRRLVRQFAAPPDAGSGAPRTVTDRERQVLTLVAHGLSNGEIGERLGISTGTAKIHVGSLLAKLAVRDRVHLVIYAYRVGLVSSR
jgi:DNA-binding NarL/FixJ family response regulator